MLGAFNLTQSVACIGRVQRGDRLLGKAIVVRGVNGPDATTTTAGWSPDGPDFEIQGTSS